MQFRRRDVHDGGNGDDDDDDHGAYVMACTALHMPFVYIHVLICGVMP